MKRMSLNINIFRLGIYFFITIFTTFPLFAQEEKMDGSSLKNKEHVMISLGYIQPLPFGENIATKAYAVSGGFEHSVWVHTGLNIWVGARLNMFFADVEKKQVTGNYDDVDVFSIGPMVGYKFHFTEDFGLLLGGGVGYVKYNNHSRYYKFYDDGTALWAFSNLDYDLTEHFGLYFSGTVRRDYLGTELPVMGKNYFNVNYVVLSLGIRVTF